MTDDDRQGTLGRNLSTSGTIRCITRRHPSKDKEGKWVLKPGR